MPPPVLTKSDMYSRIVAGGFGNTLPRWFDIQEWYKTGRDRQDLWGVQHTKIAGYIGTRLNVGRDFVAWTIIEGGFRSQDYCISPMITDPKLGMRVLWEGDITEGYACGNVCPVPGSWRTHMKTPVEWRETQYRTAFRQWMTPDSYDDLMSLLDAYPDHVIELSILDKCWGTVPGRNALLWEVRKY